MAVRKTTCTDLDRIDDKVKLVTFGYIHECEKTLFSASVHTEIPTGIVYICMLYYGNAPDEFDEQAMGAHIVLQGHHDRQQTQRITQTESSCYESAYLKRIAKRGYHEWQFRIEQCNEFGFMMIGVWRDDTKSEPNTNDFFTVSGGGYAFCTHFARQTDPVSGNTNWRGYGEKCTAGCVVNMRLDLDALTLSYSINDKDYGKAFDVTRARYRAAVYMISKGDSVSLLNSI